MLREVNKEVAQRSNGNSDSESIKDYTSQKIIENNILSKEGNSFDSYDSFKSKLVKKFRHYKKTENRIHFINSHYLMQQITSTYIIYISLLVYLL